MRAATAERRKRGQSLVIGNCFCWWPFALLSALCSGVLGFSPAGTWHSDHEMEGHKLTSHDELE